MTDKEAPGIATDSLVNFMSNLNTHKDKSAHSFFTLDRILKFEELSAMYLCDWLSGKAVDVQVDDATRNWRTPKAPSVSNRLSEFTAEEERLGVQSHFNQAQKYADAYGGGLILMITNEPAADVSKPLVLDALRPGSLLKLITVCPEEVTLTFDTTSRDILSENFQSPSSYVISGGSTFHPSRVLHFHGTKVPWTLQQRYFSGWDMSKLQRQSEALRQVASAAAAVSTLLHEAKNDAVSIPGLFAKLTKPDETAALLTRFAVANQLKSINNLMLLDSSETFTRHDSTFTGVNEVLRIFLGIAAAAADIPATRLLGQAATGLNATGEGDEKNYFVGVEALQTGKLGPQLSKLDEVTTRSVFGHRPADWSSAFNPVRVLTALEKADLQNKNADRDVKYLGAGVVAEEHVAQNIVDEGIYSSMTQEFVDALGESDDEEDLPGPTTPDPETPIEPENQEIDPDEDSGNPIVGE
jgi:phage-related protein (TIGR01555 family)